MYYNVYILYSECISNQSECLNQNKLERDSLIDVSLSPRALYKMAYVPEKGAASPWNGGVFIHLDKNRISEYILPQTITNQLTLGSYKKQFCLC